MDQHHRHTCYPPGDPPQSYVRPREGVGTGEGGTGSRGRIRNQDEVGPRSTDKLLREPGLEDSHLLQRDLDDEISERALKNLLKRLDGRKHYFLQADIEEFNQYKTTLDDLILERDVSVGTLVFRR